MQKSCVLCSWNVIILHKCRFYSFFLWGKFASFLFLCVWLCCLLSVSQHRIVDVSKPQRHKQWPVCQGDWTVRVTAVCVPPNDIQSDKSVKGRESNRNKGEELMNLDAGHGGARWTTSKGFFGDRRKRRQKEEQHDGIFICPIIILFLYLFLKEWVIKGSVATINERRAEPPTSCSCQWHPVQSELWEDSNCSFNWITKDKGSRSKPVSLGTERMNQQMCVVQYLMCVMCVFFAQTERSWSGSHKISSQS